jgi:prepilin-type N-terminal cleavage/methylation domain-containing protein
MRNQKGFSLIEVLIALGIIGVVSVSYIGTLGNATRTAIFTDEMDTGRVLAQSQMENVKRLNFTTTCNYAPENISVVDYPGYTATVEATPAAERDNFIQTITVTINHNGKTVATLQDCKAKR